MVKLSNTDREKRICVYNVNNAHLNKLIGMPG
jgi:hypothetical protein